MRVVLLANPIAGRGRAMSAAEAIAARLVVHGIKPQIVPTAADGNTQPLVEALDGAACMIVLGGDGTIRQAAPIAIEHDVPIHQYPFGTENLFAREFGMKRDVDEIIAAIKAGRTKRVDVGEVNGEIFLMMISIGFDAEVIHDLASRRKGGISHLNYVGPILRSLRTWRPAMVAVDVDGVEVPVAGPGITVIANARQYAFRLDPAPHASMDDRLLHLVHIPIRSPWSIPLAALTVRMRRHLEQPHVTRASGRLMTLTFDQPQRGQIDGDPIRESSVRFDVTLHPGALQVLLPAVDRR